MTRGTCARVVAVAALLQCPSSLAQAQGIVVSQPIRVAELGDGRILVEPHLVLHPVTPNHLLAVAMVAPRAGSDEERFNALSCASFLSTDGGRRWRQHDFPVTQCADPWVTITPSGDAVLVAIAKHATLERRGLLAFHSQDGGATWDERPLGLGRGDDHPTLAADLGTSQRRGWVYLTSGEGTRWADGKRRRSVFVARSRDGGRTFDELVRLVPNNLWNLSEMPVVLMDGMLIVSFVETGRMADTTGTRDIAFDRRRAWVARSADGGQTFSEPLFVTDACGPSASVEFQQSRLAVDGSAGPFRDRLYFVCRKTGGGPIVVTSSTNRGQIWTDPKPVSPVPDDSTDARIFVLAVNESGILAVAWTNAWYNGGSRRCQDVHMSASTDGGLTFLPAQRVSRVVCVPKGATVIVREWWATSGDYFGLAPLPDGSFQLLWGEPTERGGELWTTAARVVVAPPEPKRPSQ